MCGFNPVLVLAKGARVMLTMNLWPKVGLSNGATGKPVDFIYEDGHQPPHLPIAIIVQFNDYRGPSISETHPSCDPICPITVCNRAVWEPNQRKTATTSYCCMGPNYSQKPRTYPTKIMDQYWNVGKSSSITYVGVGRVKRFSNCVIEPLTFERLTGLKSSINLDFMLDEEARLGRPTYQTCRVFR